MSENDTARASNSETVDVAKERSWLDEILPQSDLQPVWGLNPYGQPWYAAKWTTFILIMPFVFVAIAGIAGQYVPEQARPIGFAVVVLASYPLWIAVDVLVNILVVILGRFLIMMLVMIMAFGVPIALVTMLARYGAR